MRHYESKVASKFEKHHVSRLPHPPYSPEMSPCNFWLFELLKEVLRDREFKSGHETEKAITMVWAELTFDEVQSTFHK
jgi:histone-lysine N-methyltransferase SETMAR